jgi:triosephosphate isomerase (TIM)
VSDRRPLIAGNWKMHGTTADLEEIRAVAAAEVPPGIDLLLCPPATLLARAAQVAMDTRLAIGAQDVHDKPSGAHTGCISAAMLVDAGATHVIVGHSERRADNGETDADVRAKAVAALTGGLVPIVCVGETEAERDVGETLAVVGRQLAGSLPDEDYVVAYEPVWAIGTGRTPTTAEVAEVHAFIRGHVGADVRILYGGSVKPSNAAELLAVDNVDGALVGGASLKAADFLEIARAV